MNPSMPEDLTINDMESIAEVIAEGLLGIDNAFVEFEDSDQADGQNLDTKKVSFYISTYKIRSLKGHQFAFRKKATGYFIPFCGEHYSEVLNPPPEA